MNTSTLIKIAVMTVLLSAGCARQDAAPPAPIGNFQPDDQPRAIDALADAQASVGARDDGMLREQHFTGPRLNSLGREKLIAMLNTPESHVERLTIWLALDPDAEFFNERRAQVKRFLADAGLDDDHAVVSIGANPRSWKPAQPQITRLPRTDITGGSTGNTLSDMQEAAPPGVTVESD